MADKQKSTETLDEVLKKLEEAEKEYDAKLKTADLTSIIKQEEEKNSTSN